MAAGVFAALIAAAVVASFLLGSIPSGVVIGRVVYGADPRSGGSKSIGATNMNRMFGWRAGLATFVLDACKGAAAVGLVRLMCGLAAEMALWQFHLLLVLGVLCSVLGHCFSPWLGFKGGKGVATGFGSILVAMPLVALSILGVFFVFALATRTVSGGSIAAAVAFPCVTFVLQSGSVPFKVVALVVGVAVVWAHRSNIGRFARGEEPKFSIGHGPAKSED